MSSSGSRRSPGATAMWGCSASPILPGFRSRKVAGSIPDDGPARSPGRVRCHPVARGAALERRQCGGVRRLLFCLASDLGKSQGQFQMMGPLEVQDVCDVIQWLAAQPWSDGNVGMFGVSYFAWLQLQVGALNPPHLKAIFAPWGATDFYRDVFYHGGILAHGFLRHWTLNWDNPRPMSWCREKMGDEQFRRAIEAALRDEDIVAVADLRQALENPDKGKNSALVDVILNALDGDYYQERNVNYDDARTPAFLGACWGMYGLHLPGAFRTWKRWKGPKKMVISPPLYLDRPVYQYQYESLRWFDYWLKGIDTGVMDDPPVRLFMSPSAQWKD